MDEKFINLEERARLAISLGESHFREFKSALHGEPNNKVVRSSKDVCRDIGEALVAFANADGGELLVGVEDNCEITGIDQVPERHLENFRDAVKRNVHPKTALPPVRSALLTIDSKKVLYFSVQKSTSQVHLTSDGRCVQRRDLETVPIPPDEIIFHRKERVSMDYDREFVDHASVDDLNPDLLRTVADQISPGMSIEKCLQYLDLAVYVGPGMRLRRAALLLFAKEPNRWHPRLQIRIIKVAGTELKPGSGYQTKPDVIVDGSVLELLEKGWDSLRPELVQTKLSRDARFESTVMYPELACREALVNAIAHRDYSEEGRGIEIFVFDDRMEVKNPGGLLSAIDLEDLLKLEGAHQSRNALTARVLRELGYMRELGEGVRRMFELMRSNELTAPELRSDNRSFSVTLRHSTIYNQKQSLWLEQFDGFNLNREQKAIVVLGIEENLVAPQDIWDDLGIVDTEHYRQLIQSLQELGILTSEISKASATKQARSKRVSVRKIPRFHIGVPKGKRGTKAEFDVRVQNQRARPTSPAVKTPKIDLPNPKSRLWIGNLGAQIDENSLTEFFSKFGTVADLYAPRISRSLYRGYVFVEFEGTESLDKLQQKLNGIEFMGRHLVVRPAFPKVVADS